MTVFAQTTHLNGAQTKYPRQKLHSGNIYQKGFLVKYALRW